MRKIRLLSYFIILLLCLTACGDKEAMKDNTDGSQTAEDGEDTGDSQTGKTPDFDEDIDLKDSGQEGVASGQTDGSGMAEENQTDDSKPEDSQDSETGGPVVFRFAGDMTLAEEGGLGVTMSIMQVLDQQRDGDITRCFSEDLLELMETADIFMLNNEFTFTDRGTPTPNKRWTFRADPSRVEAYNILGVDVVGLANNHAYDWGEVSLLDTLDTLDGAGIDHVGAGRNLAEAMEPIYYTINGRTFAIVAATAIEKTDESEQGLTKAATETEAGVLKTMDPTACLEAIRTAKENSDFVFMYVHWGTESTTELDQEQKDLARLYIEAGADAVIGNHPHVLQGFEFYQGKPILYSQGNFWFNTKSRETCLLEFTIDSETMESQVRFIPCLQEDSFTSVVTEESERERMFAYMESLSPGVEIDPEGIVTESSGQ